MRLKKMVLVLLVVCITTLSTAAISESTIIHETGKGQEFISYNNGVDGILTLDLEDILDRADTLSDQEAEMVNQYYEKIIEEKTGIKVKATEGIIYYDEEEANKSLNQRNEDSAKVIEKMSGVKLKDTEGILYYDEAKGDMDKFYDAASDVGIQATSPPTRVNRSYPYESDWSGTRNYSYSEYLFRLDVEETYFSSEARTPYHVEFYGTDGDYWFTLRARGTSRYTANTTLFDDLVDYYGSYEFYVIMYNDDSGSSRDAYYWIDR